MTERTFTLEEVRQAVRTALSQSLTPDEKVLCDLLHIARQIKAGEMWVPLHLIEDKRIDLYSLFRLMDDGFIERTEDFEFRINFEKLTGLKLKTEEPKDASGEPDPQQNSD